MPNILQAVCEAIEDAHGRLSPSVHETNYYNKNRNKILQEVINEKHLDEKMGSTFINIIDRKAIQDAMKSMIL